MRSSIIPLMTSLIDGAREGLCDCREIDNVVFMIHLSPSLGLWVKRRGEESLVLASESLLCQDDQPKGAAQVEYGRFCPEAVLVLEKGINSLISAVQQSLSAVSVDITWQFITTKVVPSPRCTPEAQALLQLQAHNQFVE
jgi:hypothetical protein